MHSARALLAGLVALALAPACNCSQAPSGANGDGGVNLDGAVNEGLRVDPSDVTLTLVTGQPPPTQAFKVYTTSDNQEVTASCTFALSDPSLGSMSGGVFTAAGSRGGSTTLTATYQKLSGQAIIHIHVKAVIISGCPGCPTFPGQGAPACSGAAATSTLVYPPDGVLLPPNMNQMSVQWTPESDTNLYELDFTNSTTDVRVTTRCVKTVDTNKLDSGGCEFALDPTVWGYIASANRGGEKLVVQLRTSTDGACASTSTNSISLYFAEQDVVGGVYYWKSTVSASGTGGQIWRKSFGDAVAEEQITNVGSVKGTCFGCHFLSRDGKRMTVNSDDNDSDDEYGDVYSKLVDVGAKVILAGGTGAKEGFEPGFQTFGPNHTLYLASDGNGKTKADLLLRGGDDAKPGTPPTVAAGAAGTRPTQPDWSADGKQVVYVIPQETAQKTSWGRADDDHLFGSSLWLLPYDGKNFGAPQSVLASQGENNYYPGFSPDGQFIVFNRVPLQGNLTDCDTTNHSCPNDSFSNPKARVFVLPVGKTTPIDCAALNATGDLSNSWPRWSPFIQNYKGNRLLWVTFSSTRDYGLKVRNHTSVGGKPQVQCYPSDSAEDPDSPHGQPFPVNCQQPQIWMAAVNLTAAGGEIQGSPTTDPSWPAFWLPFQDIKTHNHTAQWTTTVVDQGGPDGGVCLTAGMNCTSAPSSCCSGLICAGNDPGGICTAGSCLALGADCTHSSNGCCAGLYCDANGTCENSPN